MRLTDTAIEHAKGTGEVLQAVRWPRLAVAATGSWKKTCTPGSGPDP